ncbi:MAG: hypothetical protein HYZ31_11495 [Gammaproteobacteria bacterium]|nr:hypothetical protein [Gammaproteobacteria bacterium]
MAISVLMRRGEQYIANAHTRMCGLDFERSMECVALKRIKTALKQKSLCEGSPKGQRAGVHFFGYFLCASKESDSLSESEINLSAPGATTVNTPNLLHSCAQRGNDKKLPARRGLNKACNAKCKLSKQATPAYISCTKQIKSPVHACCWCNPTPKKSPKDASHRITPSWHK